MNPIGKVTRIDGNKVHVTFKRTSACGSCHACFTLSPTEAEVELDNDLDAEVGNYVEIMMHPSNIVKASLIMYGVPLTGLIVGVCIGAFFNVYVSFGLGVALSLLSDKIIGAEIQQDRQLQASHAPHSQRTGDCFTQG